MILVCPACDAKFKVPDGAIPPEGRKVRCASCKHSWHAVPAQALEKRMAAAPAAAPAATAQTSPPRPAGPAPIEEVDAGAAARASALRQSVQAMNEEISPAPEPAPEHDDLFDEDGAPEPAVAASAADRFDGDDHGDDFGIHDAVRDEYGDDFGLDGDDDDVEHEGYDSEEYDDGDFVARRRAEQRRDAERAAQSRKRKLLVFGWAFLVVFWLSVLFGAVFMKETVVKTFPGLQGFYDMFAGVKDVDRFRPAEGEELTTPLTEREIYVTAKLYNDRTRVETQNGRPVLMVRGFVENPGAEQFGRTAAVPQVQVDILDKQGRVLETVIADPPGFALRRGSKLDFETAVYPIPSGAVNVSVKVLEGTRSRTVPSVSG